MDVLQPLLVGQPHFKDVLCTVELLFKKLLQSFDNQTLAYETFKIVATLGEMFRLFEPVPYLLDQGKLDL